MRENIVITGANGGVGSLLSHGLSKLGHHIICLGRNEKALEGLVGSIKNEGGIASYVVADMMYETQVEKASHKIIENFKRIDVWINNVGVNNHNAIGPTWSLYSDNWWTEVELNLKTAFIGTKTAINLMKNQNKGYVINLGGGGVQAPKPFGSAYGAAKTAVVKFTETVNIELEQEKINVKVFAFNPGFIRNKRTEVLVESSVAKKYMPKLEAILKHGKMSNIEDSIHLIQTIISGNADDLSGKYFFSDDKNIDDIIVNKAKYTQENINVLRVNK